MELLFNQLFRASQVCQRERRRKCPAGSRYFLVQDWVYLENLLLNLQLSLENAVRSGTLVVESCLGRLSLLQTAGYAIRELLHVVTNVLLYSVQNMPV